MSPRESSPEAVTTRHMAGAFGVDRMSFAQLLAMGTELCRTGFMPNHVKNGAQVAAIVMAGAELGMAPMRSLRSLRFVKGNVTESADSILARFKSDGGRAIWKELTEQRAVLYLLHPNGDEHVETFTFEDAERAGLHLPTSNGERSNYLKYPKAMLRSRAITAGMKSIGWEGGAGVYDPNELETEEPAPNLPRARAPKRLAAGEVAADATVVEDEEGEELEGEEAEHDEAEAAPAPTEAQRELLTKLFASHVFTDAERGYCERIKTRAKASAAIEWAKAELESRKALEKAAAEHGTTEADGPAPEGEPAPEEEPDFSDLPHPGDELEATAEEEAAGPDVGDGENGLEHAGGRSPAPLTYDPDAAAAFRRRMEGK